MAPVCQKQKKMQDIYKENLEINCSQGLTEQKCKHCTIADFKFSSRKSTAIQLYRKYFESDILEALCQ